MSQKSRQSETRGEAPGSTSTSRSGAPACRPARDPWSEVSADARTFYRPRFRVGVRESDPGFVPGYN